jgi:hypothetical protein
MNTTTYKEIQGLSRMTVGELREKYLDVFGEETRSYHKEFLRKRIAWRVQALAEGDLSERARRRAEELANDADLRIRAPRDPAEKGSADVKKRTVTSRASGSRDPRLPLPGTLLAREFQGNAWENYVRAHGGLKQAYEALQDDLKHEFITDFAKNHHRLTGQQLKVENIGVAHRENHLAGVKSLDDNEKTFDRTIQHLKDNGVDLKKYPIAMGPQLSFDPETETFPDSPEAT